MYRPYQVWRHDVGTDPALDVLVLQEDDRRFEVSARATRCGQWVLIHAASRDSAETWAIPSQPTRAPCRSAVGGRREGHEYVVESVPGGPRPFLVVTNHGGRARVLAQLGWAWARPIPRSGCRRSTRRCPATPPVTRGRGPGSCAAAPVQRSRCLRRARRGHPAGVGRDCALRGPGHRARPGLGPGRRARPGAGHFLELGTNEEFDAEFVTRRRAELDRPAGLVRHPLGARRSRRACGIGARRPTMIRGPMSSARPG